MGNFHLNVGKYELKTQYGAYWVKIFYHHFDSSEDFFETKEDALNVSKENQYSIFLEASQWPHDGPYEFLLQYPGLSVSGYNRWKQTNFPLNESDNLTKSTVDGYENVSCTWTIHSWAGLQKGHGCSLLEGSVGHGNWYYAIGAQSCTDWTNCFPGPSGCVYTVYLWMRIPDILLLHHCTFSKQFIIRPHLFIFLFFFS